jgi:hypothetical protein
MVLESKFVSHFLLRSAVDGHRSQGLIPPMIGLSGASKIPPRRRVFHDVISCKMSVDVFQKQQRHFKRQNRFAETNFT